jgi:hypothetical protein
MLIPSGYKTDFLIPQIPTKEGVEFGTWEDHFFDVDRASIKTRVNDKNIIVDVPIDTPSIDYSDATFTETDPESINIALHSEEMDDAAWVKGQSGVALIPVVTANFATAPDGTVTADKVVFDLNSSVSPADRSDLTQTISTSNGETTSFWLKTITGTEIVTVYVGGGGTNKVITDQWVRYEVTGSASNAIAIATVGTISNDIVTVLVWGGQLSPTDELTRYVPTTTVIDGVPPLYDIEGCGVLLTENQATNLALRSDEADDVVYTKTNLTVTDNTTLAPDGTITADTLTATSSGGQLEQTITGSSTTDYTASYYVKRKTGTGTINIRSVENINTPITVTDEWQRFEATDESTTTTIRIGINIATSGDEVYVWRGQLETGVVASSSIHTEAVTVTRLKDQITNGGTVNDFNSEEGVLFWELKGFPNDPNTRRLSISDGTSNNRLEVGLTPSSTNFTIVFAVNGSNIIVNTAIDILDQTVMNKIAVKYKSGDFAIYLNGASIYTNTATYTPVPNSLNQLKFTKSDDTSLNFFGKTKQIKVYKTALSDAELIELTTP